jgi:tetratricopeptide (TPR) repeat protein
MECLFHLGWNAYLAGNITRAIEHFEESLSICHEINEAYIKVPAFALGWIAASLGDLQKAKGFFLEALGAYKKSPDSPYFLAYCLEAVCAIPGITPEKAAQLLGKAEAIREQKGYVLGISEQHLVEPVLDRVQSQLGKARFDSARAAGATLTLPQVIDEAIDALEVIE